MGLFFSAVSILSGIAALTGAFMEEISDEINVTHASKPAGGSWTRGASVKKVIVSVITIGLFVTIAGGCGKGKGLEEGSTTAPGGRTEYSPEINPADFVSTIDNRFVALRPGTTSVYEGDMGSGLEHIEVLVTGDTKRVMGVTCVVVRDTVTVGGELAEDTYDWFAQDGNGNVWYFGEDSKEYENGRVVATKGSWEAGVGGAQPGIIMKAQPVVGEEYRQEYDRGNAEDMAGVVSLDAAVSVKAGSYEGCLKTREWTPLESGVSEFKYYAPGVGLVLETNSADESMRIELIE